MKNLAREGAMCHIPRGYAYKQFELSPISLISHRIIATNIIVNKEFGRKLLFSDPL